MKMNLGPSFRYQITNYLKSICILFLTVISVPLVFIVISLFLPPNSSSFNFTGMIIVPAIFMFVTGIVAIRSDLRFCLQYGTSRLTVFVCEIFSLLSASILVSVGVEIIKSVFQMSLGNGANIMISDLYQMTYLGMDAVDLSFSQHLISILFNISLIFNAAIIGMFFSLMFWRLSKIGTVAVAISIPFVFTIVPIVIDRLNINITFFIKDVIKWLTFSPYRFMLGCVISAILFEIFNWLLLRKANIIAAKN